MGRVCSKCKIEKTAECFHKSSTAKDGLYHACKECRAIYSKENSKLISVKRREDHKKYRELNKDRHLAYMKEYNKKYYTENRSRELERQKSEKNLERRRIYQSKNSKVLSAKLTHKRRVDPFYNVSNSIRASIYTFVKKGLKRRALKNSKIKSIVGCSSTYLRGHLIKTAINNYGYYNPRRKYEIDHVIPLRAAKTKEEILKLSHWTNLQYLTRTDNAQKGYKMLRGNV